MRGKIRHIQISGGVIERAAMVVHESRRRHVNDMDAQVLEPWSQATESDRQLARLIAADIINLVVKEGDTWIDSKSVKVK